MVIIEQIERDSLKEAIKKPALYVVTAIFLAVMSSSGSPQPEWILYSAIAFILALIFIIDIKHYIIPDSAQFALFIISNLLICFSDNHSFIQSYAGAGFAFAIFYSIYYVYDTFLNKEALGFGDVKLFANAGLLLGFLHFNNFLLVLTAISVVFVIGKSVSKSENKLIPYGPLISFAMWLCLIYPTPIDLAIQTAVFKFIHLFV
ncbi:MAG: prepilin peptidase [Proteobacteria bacterium]|nr:prepilin peptidase [Pseudomonadota bacterium]